VNGKVAYQSANFTPAAPGTYRWTAAYSGDANNNSVSSACNAPNESVTVTTAALGRSAGGAGGSESSLGMSASPLAFLAWRDPQLEGKVSRDWPEWP
jgi:hypothetical protein